MKRNALLELLAARGWSDDTLARRSGIARSHVNEIKNARIVPRVSTALRIARALDLPVVAVFPPGSGRRRPRRAGSAPHPSAGPEADATARVTSCRRS